MQFSLIMTPFNKMLFLFCLLSFFNAINNKRPSPSHRYYRLLPYHLAIRSRSHVGLVRWDTCPPGRTDRLKNALTYTNNTITIHVVLIELFMVSLSEPLLAACTRDPSKQTTNQLNRFTSQLFSSVQRCAFFPLFIVMYASCFVNALINC